jgi:hypothetical protein
MEIFEVFSRVETSGEYVLGAEATGSHACYLIYGRLAGLEKGRQLKPGKGHEELILAVKGDLLFSGSSAGTLREGRALHLRGEETLWLENPAADPAVYVIAGGHGETGHH